MSRKDEIEAMAQDFACAIEQLGRLGARAANRVLTPSEEAKRLATKRLAVTILVRMLFRAADLNTPLDQPSGNPVD